MPSWSAGFDELLESMPDAILMVDSSGSIVRANRQAERLFGYEQRDLVGEAIELLLPSRFKDGHIAHRREFFRQPRTRAMGLGLELYGLRKSGEEFPVEISLSPLETDRGLFVVSAIRDITERKKIEHMLQQKNEELRRAAEAKDRFLATMSHELRTPLNAIIGFTGTLLMKLPGPLTADQEKQLSTIQASARHLLSLINDLLDLAKIESGSAAVTLETVQVGGAVEEVANSLRPLAAKKGLGFRVDIPDSELAVRTDRRAFTQILLNLLSNAIKFTEAGNVTVSARRQTLDGRLVKVVEVSDTGCGISAADQEQLFREFTQLDSSATRKHEGTGLGLYLSKRLTALIGARIECASEVGKGSTFSVIIPDA
jgi:protein-histidine pros-kinase